MAAAIGVSTARLIFSETKAEEPALISG
jgi:hypothetical protein